MAEQELNKLNLKSDSLPDNWLVTLVNPTTGAVAENMTIARLVELFTSKQPGATSIAKGLVTPDIYKALYSKEQAYSTPSGEFLAYKIKTSIKVSRYNSLYFYCRVGQSQNTINNQIISSNIKLWEYRFGGTYTIPLGSGDVKDIVIYEENDGYLTVIIDFIRKINFSGGAIDLLFRSYAGINSVVSIEGMDKNYITGSHSNEAVLIIQSTSSYLLNKNDLTDPVSNSYSFTPPPRKLRAKLLYHRQFSRAICEIFCIRFGWTGRFNSS